ncbi:MAG: hypothetical protein K2O16_01080 [Lachnospiraceae bacterium]|nr:hypothetical protein [Lachnospiraceae bacterium]MDE7330822.1 hypothetical protein [Lachnospiraceae bacterium]
MDYNNSNNPYVQQNHDYSNGTGQYIRNPGQTMATVSMVLGVLSIFTMLTVYIPFVFGSLAILFAILSTGYGKKMLATAKIGIGTGIGGMAVVTAVVGTLVATILSSSGDSLTNFGRQMDQQFEHQTGQSFEDIFGQSYEDIMKDYAEMMGK